MSSFLDARLVGFKPSLVVCSARYIKSVITDGGMGFPSKNPSYITISSLMIKGDPPVRVNLFPLGVRNNNVHCLAMVNDKPAKEKR